MIKESPCRDCTKRNVTANYNCHHDCAEYLAYRAELAELNAQERNDIYSAYIVNAVYRKRKRKHEKNRT